MTALAVVEQEIVRLEGYLDRAMGEVFGTMMGVACSHAGEVDPIEGETVAALIGLAGALAGTVVVQCTRSGAMRICGSLTGIESTEVDETVRDALGEVANMVAGACPLHVSLDEYKPCSAQLNERFHVTIGVCSADNL